MKLVQVLLIFAAIVGGWSSGEVYQNDNWAIQRKLNAILKSYGDPKVNPCADFYAFTCGKWPSQHEEYSSAFAAVAAEADEDLIRYMDNVYMMEQPYFVKVFYVLYTSCTMNEDYSVEHYMKWLEKHGDYKWALLSSEGQKDDNSTSEETNNEVEFNWVSTFATLRRFGLNNVFMEVEVVGKDVTQNELHLHKPRDFVPLKVDDLEMFNAAFELLPNFKPTEFWKEIVEFENRLEALIDEEFEIKKKTMPLSEKILGIKKTLNLAREVIVTDAIYVEELDALLKNYDYEFVCRYLEVRFLWNLHQEINSFTESNCMRYTRRTLPSVADWIYLQVHPEIEEEIPVIGEMFSHIIKHINETLRSDKRDIVSDSLLENLNTVQLKIGNYPRVETINILNAYLAYLPFNATDFYGNHLMCRAFEIDNAYHITSQVIDSHNVEQFFDQKYFSKADLHAYHLAKENVLMLPPAMLRPPFYHWGYSNPNKYALVGSILAGNIYSLLDFDGFSANEISTFVDVGGIHSAYQTYFSSSPRIVNDEVLQFFVHVAMWYCQKDVKYNFLNEIVSQLPEFAEAYECKQNTFFEIFSK